MRGFSTLNWFLFSVFFFSFVLVIFGRGFPGFGDATRPW
jgi:hypothetical protein